MDRQLRAVAEKYAEEMMEKMKEEENQDDDKQATTVAADRKDPKVPVFKV
jgi:hypothetical protein